MIQRVLLALIALLVIGAASTTKSPEIEKLIVLPDAGSYQDFHDGLAKAQKTVDMTMFHMTEPQIINALIATAQRGVQVRVMLDGKSLSVKKYKEVFDLLQAGGVQVRGSSPAFSITHEKTMVVDSKRAFITTINLVKTYKMTRDYGVITSDPGIVAEMDSVFTADWKNSENDGAYTPELSNPNLVWSPINASSRLIDLIDSAQKTIIAEVENLGHQQVMRAFTRAVARGVSVRLVLPMCGYGTDPVANLPAAQELVEGGVQVNHMPAPPSGAKPFIHAKMIQVDGETQYIGSTNFSYNSLEKAREVGIIFTQENIADQVEQAFESDWQASVPVTKETPICPDFFD